jgi:hypothetical protein
MRKCVSVVVLLLFAASTWAQTQDPNSPGFDFNLVTDTAGSAGSETTSESIDGEKAPLVVKPYERITLNIDTLTNLITYSGIVEQEESSSDSIYVRAKNFASIVFANGGKDNKGLYEVDKKNQKLVINGTLTAYSYANKYAKKEIGFYHFKMTLLIKEGRYKYIITNLVHEAPKPNVGVADRNYFEYYYNTTTNIKGLDQILRYADKDLTAMLEKFKKALREQLVLDEDEW